MKFKILAAILAFSASTAMAAPIVNGDFSTGDLSGWDTDGAVTIGSNENGRYASMYANGWMDAYTTMKRMVHLDAGDVLSGYAQFLVHDYFPYNDDAFVSIGDVNLFASSVAAVGDYGSSAWTRFDWTAAVSGDYILRIGVTNRRDSGLSSEIRVANFSVTPAASDVPEPANIALMGLGLFAAGAVRRLRAKKQA